MDFLKTKRVVLVTGKGGVGRTTLTVAMARAVARLGRKPLVAEIGTPDDDYSPLARLYGRDTLPLDPEEVEEGVWGTILFPRRGHSLFLEQVLPIPTLVRAGMRSKALGRLLDAAPSFNEMGVFNHFLSLLKEKTSTGDDRYDVVIVDMPATGHTLALTGLPETLLKLMPTGPIAALLEEGRAIMNDPVLSTAVVITLPEKLPVSECLELVEGLRETRVPCGPIIVNKVVKDNFSADESAFLDAVVEGRHLFGATRYQALAGRDEALERLRRQSELPIAVLPELTTLGDELVRDLTEALLSAEASR